VAHPEVELRSKGGTVSRWNKVIDNGFLDRQRSRKEMRREMERERERKNSIREVCHPRSGYSV
jgi:hypothetical protein